MQVGLYGMTMVTKGVTFYLWSPWRCTALEHRLFEAIRQVPGVELVQEPDEASIDVKSDKAWKAAMLAVERVLKGWQEEARDVGTDRRAWYWMIEADTDSNGYDHHGEASNIWGFIRLLIEGATDTDDDDGKSEWIDLNGFGFKVWRNAEG